MVGGNDTGLPVISDHAGTYEAGFLLSRAVCSPVTSPMTCVCADGGNVEGLPVTSFQLTGPPPPEPAPDGPCGPGAVKLMYGLSSITCSTGLSSTYFNVYELIDVPAIH